MKQTALVLFALLGLVASACNSQATVDQVSADQPAADAEADAAGASAASGQDRSETGDPADSSETAEASDTASSQPSEGTGDDDAAADDAPASNDEPEPAVDTSSPAALGGSDEWCTAAAYIENSFVGDEDFEVLSDPAQLEEAYTEARRLIQEAVQIAPPEIAPDVAEMAEGFGVLVGVLESADWDFLSIELSVLEEAAEGMTVAGYNIEKYNYAVCGIGEDPGDAPTDDVDEFDEPLPSGSARDLMVEGFTQGGFTEDEALCLVDEIDFLNPEAMSDPSSMFDAFGECGISLDRLSELDG